MLTGSHEVSTQFSSTASTMQPSSGTITATATTASEAISIKVRVHLLMMELRERQRRFQSLVLALVKRFVHVKAAIANLCSWTARAPQVVSAAR